MKKLLLSLLTLLTTAPMLAMEMAKYTGPKDPEQKYLGKVTEEHFNDEREAFNKIISETITALKVVPFFSDRRQQYQMDPVKPSEHKTSLYASSATLHYFIKKYPALDAVQKHKEISEWAQYLIKTDVLNHNMLMQSVLWRHKLAGTTTPDLDANNPERGLLKALLQAKNPENCTPTSQNLLLVTANFDGGEGMSSWLN
jgi:hypothetical protein